jgi:1,4-dihydroxy-2-naphthoate octaprenyltransferase
MVAGTSYALTGQLTLADFFAGLPIGLLTAAILWINQFPDVAGDAQAGKRNLVVVLGRRRARWGYLLLMVAAFASTTLGVLTGVFPAGPSLMLLALPLAVYTTIVVFRRYADRALIKANAATIQLHLLSGLLLAAGLLWSQSLTRMF